MDFIYWRIISEVLLNSFHNQNFGLKSSARLKKNITGLWVNSRQVLKKAGGSFFFSILTSY